MVQQGYTVGLFSLNKTAQSWHKGVENIVVLSDTGLQPATGSVVSKLAYLLALPKLKTVIQEFKPDILHAHYATSYGLLGALSRFKPFVISVWGSDVYEFPKKSVVHASLLKYNLKRADKILSTSYSMKGELWKYTTKEVEVLPFGVNTEVFAPAVPGNNKRIHLGVIKAMEDIYGIKTVLEAMQLVTRCLPEKEFRLYLIGGGKQLNKYKKLASKLGLGNKVVFTGKIAFSEIAQYHQLLDIFINVSTVNESFGVSVIESMACEKAVIVSNVPGLKEVVDQYGLIVEKENVPQLAKAIIQLINFPALREKLGKEARLHVLNTYDFEHCMVQLFHIYENVLRRKEKIVRPTVMQNQIALFSERKN